MIDSQIPPWLNVQPRDFLGAVSSGLQTGLHIADMHNMATERAASRQAEAQRQSDARDLAVWEMQNRMAQERERLAVEHEQRMAAQQSLADYRTGELELGRGRLADSQKYHEGMVASRGEVESRKQAAKIAFAKAYQDNVRQGMKPTEAYQGALLRSPDLLSATTIQGGFGGHDRPDIQQTFGKMMALKSYGALASAQAAKRKAVTDEEKADALADIQRATEAYSQYANMATNSPSAATGTRSAQEVTRLTKDGRQAIFDANTKKFLRFADEMSDEANDLPSTAGQLNETDELDETE